jgi:hypothetical protein
LSTRSTLGAGRLGQESEDSLGHGARSLALGKVADAVEDHPLVRPGEEGFLTCGSLRAGTAIEQTVDD